MQIGRRIREFRESKKLSQEDVERRTGLVRPYISRVENGHTVPSLETIEKFARALEVPTYLLFIGAEQEPKPAIRLLRESGRANSFGGHRKEERYLLRLCRFLGRMNESQRTLLLTLASAMARRKT